MDRLAAKELFLEVVARAKARFDFKLENFVIMGNHFHFLIQPGTKESLSEIMKWILQTYAINFNRKHGLWGHFWGGRFFSWVIPNFWEYIRVFHYIDNNPVQALLVKNPWEWKSGAIHQRRLGHSHIVSELPTWLRWLFPAHEPYCLESS